MNEKINPEDATIIEALENAAQGIKPNIVFEHELEKRLTAAHKPKRALFASLGQNIFPTLGWIMVLVILTFALNWAARSLLSSTPAAGDGFVCPVTEPNGSLPPGETIAAPEYLGNGELWTVLWPDGKVMMERHNLEADGSLSMKWGWWREITGPLTIEGHRLDTDAEPLRAFIPDGYGDTGLQITAVIFPTTGCWEVTGRVGESALTFVTEVLFEGVMPTPVVMQEISTPIPSIPIANDEGYDWRNTKLTLSQALPESPAESNVYSLKISQPATMDEARALAQQFGINGEVTEIPGEIPGNFDYLIFDGRQKLTVRSDHYFTYHSNTENFTLTKPPEEQAQKIIDTSLKLLGFDFEYRLEAAPEMTGPHYYILPLTADGFEMTFDYMMPLRFEITVEDIKNFIFSGYPINLEPLGTFGIHTAEEAFQKVLSSNPQFGMMEFFRGNGGGGGGSSFYKLNLSGTPVSYPTPTPAPISDRSEYIVQEGDTLKSIADSHGINTEELMQINGLSESRIFIGQVLIIPDGQPSPPAGDQPVENLRGTLSITFHKKEDDSQVTEYSLTGTDQSGEYYSLLLTGANLQGLEKYHGLPIIVWGTKNAEQFTINMERYEIPFPDLQFQILKGRQELTTLDGQSVIIFTAEDGASYVQLSPSGDPTDAVIGIQGDLIELEVLIIPDETFGGMPALRIYAGSTIEGRTAALTVTANQPYTYDDSVNIAPDNYVPPTATVEKMELAYYIRNPIYSMTDPNAGSDAQYLQPVWRFYGHYSNGDEFEILIQALKDEFLYPELAPYTPPG